MDTVGSRIAEARRQKFWTQSDLAAAVFVTQTCISYWETGGRAITVPDLLHVAAALGVQAADLIPEVTHTPDHVPVLDLSFLTADLRGILYKLERTAVTGSTVTGWMHEVDQTCTTRTGRHWHLFLHTHDGTRLRIGGLHFNTEPEAVHWGRTNLRLRHITTTDSSQ